MKKIIKIVFYSAIAVAGIFFIIRTLSQSSSPPQVSRPPDLGRAPARVYGKVEPAGREVFMASPVTRKIVRIHVKEGSSVKLGQILLSLESEVEKAQLQVALAKVESIRKTLAIDQDIMERQESLYAKEVDSEYAFTQAKLQVELDLSNVTLAEKEVDLARAQMAQLELFSPIDGVIYKFDVRLGESLTAGDSSKITLGSADLWVRLSVEAFWMDRIRNGDRYDIFDSETHALIGQGEVIAAAPYLGRRNFRTEDDQERFDTKYRDIILKLDKAQEKVPWGLSVMAKLQPPAPPEKK
jgi:multidrug efflux pump subunit AcrA (membrane-fusion protein)